jgi:hypothetical protein
MFPDIDITARFQNEADFLPEFLSRSGSAYLTLQFVPRPRVDPFTALLRLEGGRAVVCSVVDSHCNRRELPTMSDLAQNFHVSPSQARVIMKSAQKHGLIRVGARGALLDAAPLAEEYFQYYCRYLAFFALYGLNLHDRILGAGPTGA